MANRLHFATTVRILVLAVLVSLLFILASLFWPRFLYQEGIKQLKLKDYDKTVHYLDRAEKKMPGLLARTFARADMYRIYTHYGQALYHKGIQDWEEKGPSIANYTLLRKGKLYLSKADAISAITYRNSYWLTLTEEALEKLHQGLFPKLKNPYDAYAFYRKTLPLRPAGSSVRYAYIRYLAYKRKVRELPAAVENLMAIYPPAYYQLRKEPFYAEELKPAVERGLSAALANNVLTRDGYKALADLYAREKDYPKAVSHYQNFLEQDPSQNKASYFIQLGRLFLVQGQTENAFDAFEKSLSLPENQSVIINRIYRTLKSEARQTDFPQFLSYLGQRGISLSGSGLTLARIFMDMEAYARAKEILADMNSSDQNASVYGLMAEIAGKQKNWDEMELAAQKAVRLDPKKSVYRYSLARSLMHQKKYERAEQEAGYAIQYAPRESPWYYNFRASARWAQEKYAPAVTDWEKAFELKPDRSHFAYRIALGYEKLGQFEKGLSFIRKALSLEPGSETYTKLEKRLEAYKR